MPSISKASLMGAAGNAGYDYGTTKNWVRFNENSTTTFIERVSGDTMTLVGSATISSLTTSPPSSATRYVNVAASSRGFSQSSLSIDATNDLTIEMYLQLGGLDSPGSGFVARSGVKELGLYTDGSDTYIYDGSNVASVSGVINTTWIHWCMQFDHSAGAVYVHLNDVRRFNGNTSANWLNFDTLDFIRWGMRASGEQNGANGYNISECRISEGMLYGTGASITRPTLPFEFDPTE